LVEELFWLTKINGGVFVENPNKTWKGKCLGLGFWLGYKWKLVETWKGFVFA